MAGTLSYDRRGSGPPLLIVHGIGSRWQVFAPVLDGLAAHRDVISLDLPGFGASPPDPQVEPSIPGYAHFVGRFAAELGLHRPQICGSSMGGAIALELARAGAVSRAVAFAPAGYWTDLGSRWCTGYLGALRAIVRRVRPAVGRTTRTRAGRIALYTGIFGHPSGLDPDTLLADVDALVAAPSFTEAARSFAGYRGPHGKLPVPATIAWGTRDTVLTYRTQSARARTALPGARHEILRGCGHLPFSDDPRRCVELLLREGG